ncbi:MAG: radical SAM protein [Candidatus Omnitrophota bacterium]
MKYIYGPVQSRRLGFSLGISLTPYKICDFDCVYCQLGKAIGLTEERKEYVHPEVIAEELKSWLENNPQEASSLNYLTLSGLGEPTLNIKIGEVLERIKLITKIPIAVITNASFLKESDVRLSLLNASLIVPSLDAVSPKIFQRINRPHQKINIEEIINGLIALRKEFKGQIWLEVMLVSGINDDLRHIKKLKEAIEEISPDKIQLNSPVRTTAEPDIFGISESKLKKIKDILGDKCEII